MKVSCIGKVAGPFTNSIVGLVRKYNALGDVIHVVRDAA